MEDFSRTLWVSEHAKQLWQPRINSITAAWFKAEQESVYGGYRRAALQVDQWPNNPKGFVTVGLGIQQKAVSYLAKAAQYIEGQPFSVRTVTARTEVIGDFVRYYNEHNDEDMGLMLGYPPCCISFFTSTWNKGLLDPTEKMLVENALVDPQTNILLRWIGVRPVPHMPCSTECGATRLRGGHFLGLLPLQEREWAIELLSMNVEYDTMNGVAEIHTPLFKLAVGSQGTRKFRLLGGLPDGTVGGAKFPFAEDTWTNNGFTGPASMKRAHKAILDVAPEAHEIVDFGCGNGELLSKLKGYKLTGIDQNVQAILQAKRLHPGNYIVGDMFEARIPEHDLSLISLERLVETDNPKSLIEKLANKAVIYTYSDGYTQFNDRRKAFFSDWELLSEVETPIAHAALVWRRHNANLYSP